MNKLEFLGRGSGYHDKECNTAAYMKKIIHYYLLIVVKLYLEEFWKKI